jgi:hypothetical protein
MYTTLLIKGNTLPEEQGDIKMNSINENYFENMVAYVKKK